MKRRRPRREDVATGDVQRAAVFAAARHEGPAIGQLCLLGDGTRVQVTGRAWQALDGADLVEVTILTRAGRRAREQLAVEQFDALVAGAKFVV